MAESKQTGGRTKRQEPPLTIAEIIAQDNQPASTDPPAKTAERLSTRTVYVSGAGAVSDVRKALNAHSSGDDALSLALPESAIVGLPGRTGQRVAAKKLAVPAGQGVLGKASKPAWAPLVYHPKLGARPPQKSLRRFDGRKVTPVNNQSFIYGGDQRQVYYPSGYPWTCIGKVDVYPNATAENPTEWGSGVLIGDRLVLTAGHVPPVNPKSGQWKMRFTAGMYNGSPVDGPGAVSYVSDFQGYLGGVSGVDYAVLRLYEPLGTYLGYFGWKTYDSSWDGGDYWWLAGYPFDIAGAQSPSFQNGIAVLDQDSDSSGGLEIEHQGDIASGDSGGPFWGNWADGFPYVVGTTSGHESIGGPSWTGGEDNNIEAGGNALSNLLHWGRATWPA
jgi:V8-like Glu-specific endopeptidase